MDSVLALMFHARSADLWRKKEVCGQTKQKMDKRKYLPGGLSSAATNLAVNAGNSGEDICQPRV